jgi:DNA invertase Pin-like site-specific DNA recombinase
MIVGYCRTSTLEQIAGFEAQRHALEQAGCEKIFAEQTSSVAERPELKRMIDFVREGDVVVVTKIDRLARSMADLMQIIERLKTKSVDLRILDLGFVMSTPAGRLTLNLFGAVAQFEREIMLERQREGIARAKGEGKYKGRKPTAHAKAPEIVRLAKEGATRERIARQLGIGVASVYRVLKANGVVGRAQPTTTP